jgi:hypothetical protein
VAVVVIAVVGKDQKRFKWRMERKKETPDEGDDDDVKQQSDTQTRKFLYQQWHQVGRILWCGGSLSFFLLGAGLFVCVFVFV